VKGTVFFRQVKSGFWLCENGHFWCKTAPVRKLLSLYFTMVCFPFFRVTNGPRVEEGPGLAGATICCENLGRSIEIEKGLTYYPRAHCQTDGALWGDGSLVGQTR